MDVEEPSKETPAPRRRVRIDSLRRVVVETRTNPAYRFTIRHGYYLWGGTRILAKRTWDGRTAAPYERMMRLAEAGGNEELVREWEQRVSSHKAARQKRRTELLQLGRVPQLGAGGPEEGSGALWRTAVQVRRAHGRRPRPHPGRHLGAARRGRRRTGRRRDLREVSLTGSLPRLPVHDLQKCPLREAREGTSHRWRGGSLRPGHTVRHQKVPPR